jgi:hypothetical protein
MKKLAEFFEEAKGEGLSMYRLCLFMWVSNLCFNWSYVSIAKGMIQPLDPSVITLTVAFLTGKVIQRAIESKVDVLVPTGP